MHPDAAGELGQRRRAHELRMEQPARVLEPCRRPGQRCLAPRSSHVADRRTHAPRAVAAPVAERGDQAAAVVLRDRRVEQPHPARQLQLDDDERASARAMVLIFMGAERGPRDDASRRITLGDPRRRCPVDTLGACPRARTTTTFADDAIRCISRLPYWSIQST